MFLSETSDNVDNKIYLGLRKHTPESTGNCKLASLVKGEGSGEREKALIQRYMSPIHHVKQGCQI